MTTEKPKATPAFMLTYTRTYTVELTPSTIGRMDQPTARDLLAQIERDAPSIHPTLVALLTRKASRHARPVQRKSK